MSQPTSPSPPSSPKVITQRQYRVNEGKCFSKLRDVIRELTGEELQKRQEILNKAIDLLLNPAPEARQKMEVQHFLGPASFSDPSGRSAHLGGFTQPPYGQFSAMIELDPPSAWCTSTQFHPQEHYIIPGMDFTSNSAMYDGHIRNLHH